MPYFNSFDLNGIVYCDQSQTVCGAPMDTGNRIVCKEITILDCGNDGECNLAVINNGQILCDTGQSYNCNLCGNDLPYFNPFVVGDVLNFQFQQIDNVNGQDPNTQFSGWGSFVEGYIKDCCTDTFFELPGSGGQPYPLSLLSLTGNLNSFVGVFGQKDYKGVISYKNIQGIQLDTSQFWPDFKIQFPNSDCFYLEFQFDFGTPNVYSLVTEPYSLQKCENTIMIEGIFTNLDCFGYYGGSDIYFDQPAQGTNSFQYQNQLRIPGVIENESFNIEKEFVGTYLKTTSSTLTENLVLKTARLPYRVARQLANILSAGRVFFNGVEYIVDGDINRDNEVGNQWFPTVSLKRVNCAKTFNCNN